ncbi:type III pantothenate kinase [Flavobacterium sp. IMCC34852]|uniref:Type III pantothenate kinase n=1 Tax=Flavobacterium rivulicola TaxID=2732161 RepID=A0A7Y3R688_9FLAO|nr:type III pantothenate kinase [Flavobacterium sp. IMCC34852]NNT70685.1 type III pantothenate kinase [Flavobacterium sp. IMCC34852]
MLLAIDVGNTRIKSAVFEHNTLLELFVFEHKEVIEKINFILKQYPKIATLVVSSVGNLDKNTFDYFKERVKVYPISRESDFPFQNLYSSPETLGIDRMVLASAATLQFPNQNRLIIDAGTCVTYDFVNQNDQYLGGAISPGIRMRYEALHHFTAKLPLLGCSNPENFIGNTTQESIHSGVVNGITLEIDGFIEQYKAQYAKFIIILTGGDAEFLAKRLKNTIFANSNFLLEGLNQTFQYNQK